MDLALVLPAVLAALAAVALYIVIGFIPGTDETSVLLPVSLALVLAGAPAEVVLSFFIAAVVTLNLTNAIPTALVGLPGGVLSSPMMDSARLLRRENLAAVTLRKMAVGSVIGTVVSVPLSFAIAEAIGPLADNLRTYGALLFVVGAVVLALLGKARILSLLAILPLALLFQGVLALYHQTGLVPEGTSVSVSFFLSITVGPLLLNLLELLNTDRRAGFPRGGPTAITMSRAQLRGASLSPRRIVDRGEFLGSAGMSAVSSLLFFLSPVAQTFLFGEAAASRTADPVRKASRAITAMSALAHSTYLSGIIIPLVALGIPLSPVAVGPAQALFNAPPVYDVDRNVSTLLSTGEMALIVAGSSLIALVISYVVAVKFSYRITYAVSKYIPHEAVLALFIGFVVLLAYLDAGIVNVFGVLLVGLVCGTLNRLGVNYGVQFMVLYASPWLIENLL